MNTENELQEATGTRWQPATLIYAVLTGGLILSYLVTQAFDKPNYEYPAMIALLRLVAAAMGIYLGKLWKDKGFWLMIAYLAYKAVRIAVKGPNLFFTSQVSDDILNGFWVVAGCYALGRVLSISLLKQFLRILIALWTAGVLVHCGLAIYAAWTSQRIQNLSGESYWGGYWDGRLLISFLYPTTSGSAMSISLVVVVCALLAMPGKLERVYYFLSLIVIMITLGLTDARTSYISAAAGSGVAAGCVILNALFHFRQKDSVHMGMKVATFRTLSVICMTIVSICFLFLFNSITPAFIRVRDRGGILVTVAKAEEASQKQNIVNRGFGGQDSLSGRDVLWQNVIGYLVENPRTLLFGDSIYNPMSGPNVRNGGEMGHCHNMVLQIVLESGIIGLLFIVLFTVYVAYYAVRLMFGVHVPLWKRMIPAIPVSVLVGDLAECFAWFRSWNSQALIFLFASAGIIVSLGKSKEQTIIHS